MSKRECGSCSLCCKVLDVPALYKPAGQWCKHFAPGKGCATHQLRPKSCRDFSCLWLTEEWLGDEWKPSVAKFVLAWEYDDACLAIMVDPKAPNAWKAEPYQSAFRALAEKHAGQNRIVMVVEPHRRTLILPDQEIVVGGRDDVFAWEIAAKPLPERGWNVVFDRVEDGGKGGPTAFEKPEPAVAPLPTISFSD